MGRERKGLLSVKICILWRKNKSMIVRQVSNSDERKIKNKHVHKPQIVISHVSTGAVVKDNVGVVW